ncbi:MAG: FAD binding domain-containing protein [Candidatus Hadarchaeota archaeon]
MEFHHPKNLAEAARLLKRQSSLSVAGATSFTRKPKVSHLVDITRLGLDYIKADKSSIRVGAGATISDLEKSEAAGLASGILRAACSTLSDTPLRNMITVGGDIACRFPWANLPPALLVLDAEVIMAGLKRPVPLEKFLSSRQKSSDLIKEVVIPRSLPGKGSFIKFAMTKTDYSILTVAAYAEMAERNISKVRLAVSGSCKLGRLKKLEWELEGMAPEAVESAVRNNLPNITMYKSILASEGHLREVLGVIIQRALADVMGGE